MIKSSFKCFNLTFFLFVTVIQWINVLRGICFKHLRFFALPFPALSEIFFKKAQFKLNQQNSTYNFKKVKAFRQSGSRNFTIKRNLIFHRIAYLGFNKQWKSGKWKFLWFQAKFERVIPKGLFLYDVHKAFGCSTPLPMVCSFSYK